MKDYFVYLQEVLGLETVVLPEKELSSLESYFFTDQGPLNPSEIADCEVLFLNILTQAKESLYNPAVGELFDKMKSAMKLRNQQFLELDCTIEDRSLLPAELAKICRSKVVVVFSSFPRDIGEFVLKGSGRWLETYSPAYLLEDPGAKKVVWNDLQKVMRELGL